MIKDSILKPLPKRIHIVFWTLYFIWIAVVNTYKYGSGHLLVILLVAPVMLAISYANRAFLRRMLFKKFSTRHLFILLGYFLCTVLFVYFVLYLFPNQLSRKVLKNPLLFKVMDFGIDILTFYFSFALKGVMILAIEVIYNMTVGLFRYLGLIRAQSITTTKTQLFRSWVAHFMGNLTQSFLRLVSKSPSTMTRFDTFLKLQAYGVRQLNLRNKILGELEDEIFYLQQLMELYNEKRIELRTYVSDLTIPILPMALLSLYKNMIKHADLNTDQLAIIQIYADEQKLVICSVNSIAKRSAWIFEAGGTGLEQLTKLLHLEYGDAFSLIKKTANGVFYLNLEITF